MKKALHLLEIDQAVPLNEPVGPGHPFYTDFTGLRGDFEEKIIYRSLNVSTLNNQFRYDINTNAANKSLVFLGGMRGTGKTSELLGYEKKLNNPECFFTVFCRLDEDLNTNDMEYMDILILQLEKLTRRLKDENIRVNQDTLRALKTWFSEQVAEINRNLQGEAGLELGGGAQKGSLWNSLLGIFGELKASVTASTQRTNSVRTVLKKNYIPFKDKFNEFVAEAGLALREAGKAKDVLFIIDGLEKTNTPEIRRKIVVEESSRIRLINANMLFILPIELMKERQTLRQLTEFVCTFPNIKIQSLDGKDNEPAINRLMELVFKRIDAALFEDNEQHHLVKKMIRFSGGNPRELLRILSYAAFHADEGKGLIDEKAVNAGLQKLANETTQFLTADDFSKLKELKENNERGRETPYDERLDDLLEKVIIYEYNTGTFKRVNPVIELSKIYREQVGT